MVLGLVLRGVPRAKARFACAVAGIAIAIGALLFMASLVSTNNAQAPAAARKACQPWAAWRTENLQLRRGRGMPPPGKTPPSERPRRPPNAPRRAPRGDLLLDAIALTIDYRPGGHVLQGPPMMALLAAAPRENPYGAVSLVEGRWVDEKSPDFEVVCVRSAMRRFKSAAPALGERIKFVGRTCTMTAKIVGYLDGAKLPPQFPYVFANAKAHAALATEEHGTVSFFRSLPSRPMEGLLTAESPEIVASFRTDDQKRMDYATPLLLAAALLTALTLLAHSLLLSIESNRRSLAILRMIGMTRFGIVRFVFVEALVAALVGWVLGVVCSSAALAVYVACDAVTFPAGMALAWGRIGLSLLALPFVILLAVLFALAPALRVRPLDAQQVHPKRHCRGMAITFACGFAAFVAVEVWGASLMRAFIPSPEWPDAIVSILPSGVSSFDVEKLRTIEGVRRISELLPLQLDLVDDHFKPDVSHSFKGRFAPNVLFLAAEWLPQFRFCEGTWQEAQKDFAQSDAVIITEMMSNARNLHKGDKLNVWMGRGERRQKVSLPIAGVVDLNWHMVTSRGLVRGLNGAPGMADGPAFCSFDTLESLDMRPAFMVRMTHLWVEYEPSFLKKHGVFAAGRRIEAEIAKCLGNPVTSTVRLHARDEIADGTLAHGTDVIGQAARVPFVFLAILAIGFVAMLVAEAESNRRALRVLRAVGATHGQLAHVLTKVAVKTALAGMCLGLSVGALVGWLFTFKTGSIWPGLPHWFVLPWQIVLKGAFGALLFALLFAIPTSLALTTRRKQS